MRSQWSETNARLGIRQLTEMDAMTQRDIASVLAGESPCEVNATKCEYCPGGCQDLQAAGAAGVSGHKQPLPLLVVHGPI